MRADFATQKDLMEWFAVAMFRPKNEALPSMAGKKYYLLCKHSEGAFPQVMWKLEGWELVRKRGFVADQSVEVDGKKVKEYLTTSKEGSFVSSLSVEMVGANGDELEKEIRMGKSEEVSGRRDERFERGTGALLDRLMNDTEAQRDPSYRGAKKKNLATVEVVGGGVELGLCGHEWVEKIDKNTWNKLWDGKTRALYTICKKARELGVSERGIEELCRMFEYLDPKVAAKANAQAEERFLNEILESKVGLASRSAAMKI